MTKTKANILLVTLLSAAGALGGCRGELSPKPPVHLVQNMDFQDKLKAQSKSEFPGWTDHRGMRLPVPGTVPWGSNSTTTTDRGFLGEHDPDPEIAKLHIYQNADETYVEDNPVEVTREVLARGQELFNITCAVCHGLNGRGQGIVGLRMPVRPPTWMPEGNPDGVTEKPAVYEYADGKIFDVITTGGGTTMQPYASQISAEDRWKIIHYVRALQYRAILQD